MTHVSKFRESEKVVEKKSTIQSSVYQINLLLIATKSIQVLANRTKIKQTTKDRKNHNKKIN